MIMIVVAVTCVFVEPTSGILVGILLSLGKGAFLESKAWVLCKLRQGPLDVASLIQVTGFSQSHISRQLGQLQRAGLVTSERDGVRLLYRAEGQLVEDLCLLVQTRLRQRLEAQLESLALP